MSKHCPFYGIKVLYLDCLECEEKYCKKEKQMDKIVVGIDQSYKDTGITVAINGEVKLVTECFTHNLDNNSLKRKELKKTLTKVFDLVKRKASDGCEVVVVIERIRLQSQGFVNIDYIKSIGALNALIVDLAKEYGFPVFSADTRAWKSAVIGNSKGQNNKYGFDPKKWPTILWCISKGYKDYIIDYEVGKKKKAIIEKDGERYTYNDNKADSIGICLYGFNNKALLKEEH